MRVNNQEYQTQIFPISFPHFFKKYESKMFQGKQTSNTNISNKTATQNNSLKKKKTISINSTWTKYKKESFVCCQTTIDFFLKNHMTG